MKKKLNSLQARRRAGKTTKCAESGRTSREQKPSYLNIPITASVHTHKHILFISVAQ